jgi:glycosyltransferase involved in cell wall biosynthesis
MTGPLVSVVIPCYNVVKYVEEAINSIINQTYTRLEILIIDDGSTDGTVENFR